MRGDLSQRTTTAEALQAIYDLDLSELEAVEPHGDIGEPSAHWCISDPHMQGNLTPNPEFYQSVHRGEASAFKRAL
jgi:hypothetical protein